MQCEQCAGAPEKGRPRRVLSIYEYVCGWKGGGQKGEYLAIKCENKWIDVIGQDCVPHEVPSTGEADRRGDESTGWGGREVSVVYRMFI
jgi:hypothetical protein